MKNALAQQPQFDARTFNHALQALELPLLTVRQFSVLFGDVRRRQEVCAAIALASTKGHPGAIANLQRTIEFIQKNFPTVRQSADDGAHRRDLEPTLERKSASDAVAAGSGVDEMRSTRKRAGASSEDTVGATPTELGAVEERGHANVRELEGRPEVRVHGRRAALCAFPDETRTKRRPTIMLETASSTLTRAYDWKSKICLQCTTDELHYVAALLLGYVDAIEFKNHGPQHTKGFLMRTQADGVYLEMWDKAKPKKCLPIPPAQVAELAALCLQQLRQLLGCSTLADTRLILQHTIARFERNRIAPSARE